MEPPSFSLTFGFRKASSNTVFRRVPFWVRRQQGEVDPEAFLADYSSSSESGSFFSGVAATGGDQRDFRNHFPFSVSPRFVVGVCAQSGLGRFVVRAQLLTSGRVGFSVTGLQGPTFDLHLDSLAYRFHLSRSPTRVLGSQVVFGRQRGGARWSCYSLAGDPRKPPASFPAVKPIWFREGAFGFVDTSRLETASFGEIPADAIHLSLGWSTMVEDESCLRFPSWGM